MHADETRTDYRLWPKWAQITLVLGFVLWALPTATWLLLHGNSAGGSFLVVSVVALICWTHLQWVPKGSRISLRKDGAEVGRGSE